MSTASVSSSIPAATTTPATRMTPTTTTALLKFAVACRAPLQNILAFILVVLGYFTSVDSAKTRITYDPMLDEKAEAWVLKPIGLWGLWVAWETRHYVDKAKRAQFIWGSLAITLAIAVFMAVVTTGFARSVSARALLPFHNPEEFCGPATYELKCLLVQAKYQEAFADDQGVLAVLRCIVALSFVLVSLCVWELRDILAQAAKERAESLAGPNDTTNADGSTSWWLLIKQKATWMKGEVIARLRRTHSPSGEARSAEENLGKPVVATRLGTSSRDELRYTWSVKRRGNTSSDHVEEV